MDIKTIILTLAIGSFVFGFLLMLFQIGKKQAERIPFWVTAKFMQGAGSLLLYYREATPEFVTLVVANSLLLCGCAYEAWAIFHITGRKVSRRIHLTTASCIVLVSASELLMSPSNKIAVNFFIHTMFYALPGWALLSSGGKARSLLRSGLGWGFLGLALIFGIRSIWAILIPEQSHILFGTMIYQIMLPAIYCMMLISGFSMLLLAKEEVDRNLNEALVEQKAIFETLPTGLVILKERVVERCNPAMESMFRYLPGTLPGTQVASMYQNPDDNDKYSKTIYKNIGKDNYFEGEIPLRRKNGEPFWAWVQGTSIFQERAEAYAVFSITDISQQKLQQQLLAEQKEELATAYSAKKMFLKMVAHEFRTPLGLLSSSSDILDRYWERLSKEERDKQTSRIRSAADQINSLTNSILSYNQSEPADSEITLKSIDIADTCRTIAADAETVWSDRHRFSCIIEEGCGSAMLDPTLIRRIMQNLLSNAFRYTPPGGEVGFHVSRMNDTLYLTVTDSGIGISEEDQQHIFDAYYRGHNIGVRRGLGLGLAIVRESVDLMGGSITLSSTPGSGTRIQAMLPLKEKSS